MKRFIKKNNLGEIKKNQSFKNLTSMRVGGKIKYLIYPNNINSFIRIMKKIRKRKFLVLGNGTNIIPSDRYYKGIVISLKKMPLSFNERDNEIEVSANYSVMKLATKMAEKGYGDYAFLSGIPGNMAGVVVMNAGAYNHQIEELFLKALIVDEYGKVRTITKSQIDFSYRYSTFREKKWTILSVTLKKGNKGTYVMNKIKEWKLYRAETQPLTMPNCGSIFKNEKTTPAWKIIEGLGLRGYTIGEATYSLKHANFIVNLGNAKAMDVYALVSLAKRKAYDKYKINLKTEIIFFNFKKKQISA